MSVRPISPAMLQRINGGAAITADARKVTPLQFLDALGLSSPEKRAARDEYHRIQNSGDPELIEADRKRRMNEAVENLWAEANAYRIRKGLPPVELDRRNAAGWVR